MQAAPGRTLRAAVPPHCAGCLRRLDGEWLSKVINPVCHCLHVPGLGWIVIAVQALGCVQYDAILMY